MANINDNRGQQGPIIVQDKSERTPYSKRIIFFGLILIAFLVFFIVAQLEEKEKKVKEEKPQYSGTNVNPTIYFPEPDPPPPRPPQPTSVAINPLKSISLDIGSAHQFSATVQPSNADQSVKWSSNNISVATVNEHTGFVVARTAGNATITARTSTANRTDTAFVTVLPIRITDTPRKEPRPPQNPDIARTIAWQKDMDRRAKTDPVTGVSGFKDDQTTQSGGGRQSPMEGLLQLLGMGTALQNVTQQPGGAGANSMGGSAQQGGSAPISQTGLTQQRGEGDQYLQAQMQAQANRENFMRNTGASLTSHGYSGNIPIPQQYYLELKAGTVIPGILRMGLNSDLPGPVMGQVSENVWDSTHGRFVLIPKGTIILGVYDSQIMFGQKRILVVWNRLIFPNGTALNIAGSPGLDQSGYSGMRGKVNNHWGEMIKAALFVSLFIAGAEMISPRDERYYYNQARRPEEIVYEQLTNRILDMGTRIMDRSMNIPPTIVIKPGYRFNVFIDKDIIFPEPYPIGF